MSSKTVRTSMGLERETVKTLDEIADGFEDYVSRGEVIDLIVAWAMKNGFDDFLDETFGDEDSGGKSEVDEDESEARESDDADESDTK